ncbi:MAG: thioredoxin family protein [Pseudomonadota bacterium]
MARIRIISVLLTVVVLLLAACSGESRGDELTPARDLARAAEQNAPIIVAFVSHDCPYCEYVEERHLKPMERDIAAGEREEVVIRLVDIHDDGTLVDFSGEAVAISEFVERHEVQFTPTLLFFDPAGEQQAEPLIGMNSEDYYGGYVEERLEQVRAGL